MEVGKAEAPNASAAPRATGAGPRPREVLVKLIEEGEKRLLETAAKLDDMEKREAELVAGNALLAEEVAAIASCMLTGASAVVRMRDRKARKRTHALADKDDAAEKRRMKKRVENL